MTLGLDPGMTNDMLHLEALLEKNSDTDFLRDMIAFAAQRLMDLGVEGLTGAGHGERNADRLCGEIDGKIDTFLERPIEGDWPYIQLDATYVKARRDGRIVSVTVIIAVGVNSDGRREVLGILIAIRHI